MTPFTLHPHECVAANSRRLRKIVRPVEPQPTEHDFGVGGISLAFIKPQTVDGYDAVGVETMIRDNFCYLKEPLFVKGESYWGREAWQSYYRDADGMWTGGDFAFYQSTYDEDPSEVDWKPEETMPERDSRITIHCKSITAVRLGELTIQQMEETGIEPDWDEFDSRTFEMDGWEEPEDLIEECEQECDWVNFGRNLVYSREHAEWELNRKAYALRLGIWRACFSEEVEYSFDLFVWLADVETEVKP